MIDSHYSRMPVYSDTIDNIFTVCHNITGFFITKFKDIMYHLRFIFPKDSLLMAFIYHGNNFFLCYILGIFEFGDKEAGDIMTHRKNISALDGNDIFEDVITLVIESHYSRMPVYSDTIDNIIGVLHIKETLSYSRQPEL